MSGRRPRAGGSIGTVDPKRLEEVRGWFAQRLADREAEEKYWDGYSDGLDRRHEPEEPEQPEEDDGDWIRFGPDGKVIEQAPESSETLS